MSKTTIMSAFNKHFIEFIDEVEILFPEHRGVRGGKMALMGLKKYNPRMLIQCWKDYVADKYRDDINNGDANAFIERDYTEDCLSTGHPKMHVCLKHINDLRSRVRDMGEENKTKSIGYIINLTKLCDIYFEVDSVN